MRRVRQWVDPARLAVYEGIIELYAPYVLVRCARYTNSRRHAQQIGAYTLITACLVAGELEQVGQLGRVVDIVLGVVGPDVLSGGRGQVSCGACDELLIVDQRMRKMAAALNSLKRPWREALVLHYVTGMPVGDLARLLVRPAGEIVRRIRRGERLLAARLGAAQVRSSLARFAAGLDAGWIEEVSSCATEYLARRAGEN